MGEAAKPLEDIARSKTLPSADFEVPELEDEDPRLGEVLDQRYRLVARLGEGGMGLVYEATHVILKSRVAVKILRPDATEKESIERLEREAQSASAIGNPHIVDVRDFGRLADGSVYIVMELIEGIHLLDDIRRHGRIAPERARKIALQVTEALGDAHDAGIVHRDLKPENVLLTARDGEADFVKIVDFGIARMQGASKLTQAGRVVGTPEYMAPEQCAGLEVDSRADIYALGILLYEMLTGKLPLYDNDLTEMLRKQIKEKPEPPSRVAPDADIPLELEAIVIRCLAKRPSKRFQTMAEVGEALRTLDPGDAPDDGEEDVLPFGGDRRATPSSTPSMPPVEPAPEPGPGLGRWAVLAVALIALVVGVGVTWSFFAASERPVAEATPQPPIAAPPAPEAPPEPIVEPPAEPEPAATPAAAAQITIESEPPGARIYRDGALLGETPLPLRRPAEGERIELTLRQRGFQDETVTLGALSGEHVSVHLAAARPSSARPSAPEAAEPTTTRPAQATPEPPPERPDHRPAFLNPWD